MTVRELMEALATCDPEAVVIHTGWDDCEEEITEVDEGDGARWEDGNDAVSTCEWFDGAEAVGARKVRIVVLA